MKNLETLHILLTSRLITTIINKNFFLERNSYYDNLQLNSKHKKITKSLKNVVEKNKSTSKLSLGSLASIDDL